MTAPDSEGDRPPPGSGSGEPPSGDSLSGQEPARRPGTSTFTIEGRAAPALFVVGWLATLAGFGLLFVSVQSPPGPIQLTLLLVALVALAIGLVAAAGSQGIERRVRGVEAYRGPSPILVFAAVIPIASVVTVIIAAPLSFIGVDLEGALFRFVVVAAQALLYMALIRLLVVDTRALSWSEMGVRRPTGSITGELLIGASWALPVIVVTIPISALLVELLKVTPESPLPSTGESVGFVIQLVAGAILAPIGEELFFRAFATTAWVRSLGPGRAIIRAGTFFAFVHVVTIAGGSVGEGAALALIGFATRVPIGIALSWLFVRRGTIWASIGLHATFNGALLIIAEAANRAVG